MQVLIYLSVSANSQLAHEHTTQHREKVAHIHGHDCQHAAWMVSFALDG